MSHKHKEEKQIAKSVLDALLSQMPFPRLCFRSMLPIAVWNSA